VETTARRIKTHPFFETLFPTSFAVFSSLTFARISLSLSAGRRRKPAGPPRGVASVIECPTLRYAIRRPVLALIG
jgi:hypothetical protein